VESRSRILDAAERLIAENGFDATPTARVAEAASVPNGLVFHYFPTKTELLTALISERTNADALRDVELEIVPGDVAGTLTRLAERFRKSGHSSERMRRIIFRETETHPEVRDCVSALYREAVKHVREAVDAALGHAADGVPEPRREAVAAAFAALLIHDANYEPLTGDTIDLAGIASVLATGVAT
jgi:AcrR family transcriptional regulator